MQRSSRTPTTSRSGKKRQVLLGAANRPDIVVSTLANSDNKRELDKLAEAAKEAAGANQARETGTALHRIIERVDSGETLDLPSPWREDVIAYVDCLATLGAEVELIEEVVVCPRLGLAGRLDRTVLISGLARRRQLAETCLTTGHTIATSAT